MAPDQLASKCLKGFGLRSAPEIKRQLDRYVLPRWKDRPFVEIRRSDVNALLDSIADREGLREDELVDGI